jgi:AGCS family alanine or glycine:cation symporter
LFAYGNLEGSNVVLNSTGKKVGGVDLTSIAFDSAIPNFSLVLTLAVILFAFSTMLSWSYYGIQGWKYLFGKGRVSDLTYKTLFLFVVIVGASSSLNSVIEFSDAMIFAMVFPNIIGLLFLAPKVKIELNNYLKAIGYQKE